MENKTKLNLAAAKFMGFEAMILTGHNLKQDTVYLILSEHKRELYDITENHKQLNEFVEKARINVTFRAAKILEDWIAHRFDSDIFYDEDRTTAILKCAAAMLEVEYGTA